MTFPKGEVVHQNLSTEYTDVPDLLSTLTSNGFAGYVEIELPQQRKGAFLISKGRVLGAVAQLSQEVIMPFSQETMDELLNLSNKEVGALSIYKLSEAQIDAIVTKLSAEIVFKGLSTDFVKLDKFIQKLATEHHTGYIEVFSKTNKAMGTLFLNEGELVDLHIPSEFEDLTLSEPKAIPTFLEDVIREGGVFDVYRSLVDNIPSAEFISEDEIGARVDDHYALSVEAEPFQEETDNGIEANLDTGEDKYEEFNTNGRGDALNALQEIVAKTEEFVDGFSREGIFLRAFKRALIERSDSYPFLDPFTDQFDYKQGKMVLDEEIKLDLFAAGFADSFNLTLSHLKREFPKNMNLSAHLKTELESQFKLYEDAMRRSGIQSVPQVLFK